MADLLDLTIRTRRLGTDAGGHNTWFLDEIPLQLDPHQTALLLCDVWDNHHSRGAVERLNAMIPRMEAVVSASRERGMLIIHAPSDTMDYYAEHPARVRAIASPSITPPIEIEHDDPPLPIDDTDGGSDTNEPESYRAWSRQHPGITIDAKRDAITDQGNQVLNFLQDQRRSHLLIMGVHTNMCVLNRSFAIKQMVRWGVRVLLVRDLTDTMYNPARSPYVSHAEGTRLVIEYIEKFWCPTVESRDLLV